MVLPTGKKRPRGLYALFGHLPYSTSVRFIPNIHVTTNYPVCSWSDPYMCYYVLNFTIQPAVFLSYMPFSDKCTEWPQNYIEHYKVRGTPYMCYWCSPVLNLSPFCSLASRFCVTKHLRQVHRIKAKRPWTIQDQMYPICVSSVPESQIAVLFGLRPAVFEIQAIFRKVHRMTTKWPWIRQGQKYPIYMYVLLIITYPI